MIAYMLLGALQHVLPALIVALYAKYRMDSIERRHRLECERIADAIRGDSRALSATPACETAPVAETVEPLPVARVHKL